MKLYYSYIIFKEIKLLIFFEKNFIIKLKLILYYNN